MTEFAFVLPIFCLLLFGIIQFGIIFNNYVTLTDAVRAGARVAAVSRNASDRCTPVQTRVRDSAQSLTQSDLAVPCPSSSWNPGSEVSVTATYPWSINLIGIVVASGNLTSTSKERVE